MDDLFSHSLWTMWKRAYPTEEEKVRADVGNDKMAVFDEENVPQKNNESVHVERK
jgi:hypothetical protein